MKRIQTQSSARKVARWTRTGEEPLLQDVFNDPIFDLIRARDGISLNHVCKVVQQARARLMPNIPSSCTACP